LDHFLGTLQDAAPPDVTPLLLSLWRGLRGDWAEAHELAQESPGCDGAWVHAWLHRIEGDLSNAAYWYRHASQPVARGDTTEEGIAIAKVLIDRGHS
jgi:hypothetical protein